MSVEVFRILDENEHWHIQGVLPKDDYMAARLINIMYDATQRKVGEDQSLSVVVSTI